MFVTDLLRLLYMRRLRNRLPAEGGPRHVGVIMDGNRRWARNQGADAAAGHQAGAEKILEFLGWCEEARVEVVTLWMLSTDNLGRSPAELEALLGIIGDIVEQIAAAGDGSRYRVKVVGALDVLPEAIAERLQRAADSGPEACSLTVNVAVGYGGRREITDAVRSYLGDRAASGATLTQVAQEIDVDDISAHLYTKGQPDPDLLIRTSGEQRLSGFLMWQSAHSEFYFCDAYWPGFREIDFLRALRDYAQRERRFGG
ncbi:isoprenyl transferase [Micrococcales bacterium 31B]|nr:isoprenyl transferase [Micrococcales bacterium 31B]